MRTALIAGVTGLVGQELLKLLIKEDYYNSVHVIVRRPFHLEHEKVKEYVIDFDNILLFQPEAIITDVYVCLGTTMKKAGSKAVFRKVDHDYVVQLASWARINHARSFAFISSMGVKEKISANFYLRTKWETEIDVSKIMVHRTFIFRPSLILGKRKESRLFEKLAIKVTKLIDPVFKGRWQKYKPVQASQIALAMFKIVANEANHSAVIENEYILKT